MRPLLSMRREEVHQILRREGLTWREDSSNQSERFTRNRVRAGLLPDIAQAPGGMDGLRAFARAVEGLESNWPSARCTCLGSDQPTQPGRRHPCAGRTLTLPEPSTPRALASAARGHRPSRRQDRARPDRETAWPRGRNISRSLPGDWTLRLETERLVLLPRDGPGWHAPCRPAPGASRCPARCACPMAAC
ncbi:MAG: ATP-binding protein [Planctomycetota bacterium]